MHTRTTPNSAVTFSSGIVIGLLIAAAILESRRLMTAFRNMAMERNDAFPKEPEGNVEEMVEHNWQGF